MSLPVPEQSTRNRSASAGDSGLPEHEHKRPRLSESQPGELGRAATPTSSDQTTNKHTVSSSPKGHVNPVLTSLSRPSSPPSGSGIAGSPTSKVTINTRPLSSQSMTHSPTAATVDGIMSDNESSKPVDASLIPQTFDECRPTSPGGSQHQHETISISSSESNSPPPIEVAAPEDFDQDPSETQWQSLSRTDLLDSNIDSGYVHRTFPYARSFEVGSAHGVLVNMATVFINGNAGDGDVFKQVKTWLVDFVRRKRVLEPAIYDAEPEFWSQFYQLASSLIKREIEPPAGAQVKDLVEFFVAYARLTRMIIDADIQRFRSYPDDVEPKVVKSALAHSYLQVLYWSFSENGIPLYHVLYTVANYDTSLIINAIIESLLDSGAVELINSLAELFDVLSAFIPKKQPIVSQVLHLLKHAEHLIRAFVSRSAGIERETTKTGIQERLMSASLHFLETANAALERAIVKQHTWMTIENSETALKNFESFIQTLVTALPQLSKTIVSSAGVDAAHFDSNTLPGLAPLAWKFMTLQRFIKHGRMELRVSGIGTMADDLVKVFKNHIQGVQSRLDHPVVVLMARFIRDNQLIKYIIGVDSHPQIINRSSNVVGFLCVSHTYQDEDTDVIWQTVLESQDPRAGIEVLQVLQSNFENIEFSPLRYIVTKLLELPFERFSINMFDFACKLLIVTTYRLENISSTIADAQLMNSMTIKLCVKLLREGQTPQLISSDLAGRIRLYLPEIIENKLRPPSQDVELGVPLEDLQLTVRDLCVDIRSHNIFACGSIMAISRILNGIDQRLAAYLVAEYDLTALIVHDIVDSIRRTRLSYDPKSGWIEHDVRITSLPVLMAISPDSFSQTLLKSLWKELYAALEVHSDIRGIAWKNLAQFCERCPTRSTVLDRIIVEYLPTLPPSEYDRSLLDFVQQSVLYEANLNPPDFSEADEIVSIPGIERVWRIMLTAPANTVETQASDFIIREYLESATINRMPLASVEATHLALIDRCVQQTMDAATRLRTTEPHARIEKGSTEITGDAVDSKPSAFSFHRSLLFLRRFLDALKAKPRFSPANRSNTKQILDQFRPKGDIFELTIQIHGHKSLLGQPQKWEVGFENTASELWQFTSEITGWSQFNMIYGGRRVDYKDNTISLRELNVGPGMLMVSKAAGSTDTAPSRAARASSPVDNKVMHHFDQLYELLELDNHLAKEVYEFLTMFTSQEEVLDRLKSTSIAAEALLPVEKPYKLMYYARALRSCIEDESFSSTPSTSFLVYAIKAITTTFTRFDQLAADANLKLTITHGFVEALLLAFRAKVSEDVSHSYFPEPALFVNQMVSLWSRSLDIEQTAPGVPALSVLVRVPFESLVEALLHDERLWVNLPANVLTGLLNRVLLLHPVVEVRQAILDVFLGLTGFASVKSQPKANDPRAPRARFTNDKIHVCMLHFWNILTDMVVQACESPGSCQEYFDVTLSLLRGLGKNISETDLCILVRKWQSLLLHHRHVQEVGHALQDFVIVSLGKLLLESYKAYPSLAEEASTGTFGRGLFTSFLFPPLSEDSNPSDIQPLPIIAMPVRQVLYDLVLAVSRTKEGLEATSGQMDEELVPKDFFYQPFISNDRQLLRSEVGYAGLRNLSNTCYLNSLFSQLFMNIEFRDFLQKINIVDESKQKLVVELNKVFAFMQNSYEEAVSPESAVDAITQWDGEQIDVTVQMDVDEFFNLVFDRIEFQILDPQIRNQFKAIYGGQLVQQIKSIECEHVSERLEPFSAVQVEIKGKSGLEESLKAYVAGEVLQGENKYSCTGCGRHVDAVKRACLKDVPNHLIFNLKRFDYDIMTGMRCKVNDEFHFPEAIDIAPYTLEALRDTGKPTEPDMFELVGIIIHSGTAESGHYYSYIRQRPSANDKGHSWVQFNDHDVTRFDPASIRDCAFGGIDFGAIQCPKFYNGYMLFYQRTSSITQLESRYVQRNTVDPVRLPLPTEYENHIAQQNELYLRNHVAQDPAHARFVRQLVQRLPGHEHEQCTADHELEAQLFATTLDYINQVSARWKDQPEVPETLKALELYAMRCEICAREVVRWFLKNGNFNDNVVRSCYVPVRKGFASLLCICWQALARHKNQGGLLPGRVNTGYGSSAYESLLSEFLSVVAASWDTVQRYGRAWEQYFETLSFVVNLGDEEAQIVIDEGFLERALELVHVHVYTSKHAKQLRPKYSTYLLGRERNRPFHHTSLLVFVKDIILHVALDAPIDNNQYRAQVGDKFGPLFEEAILLGLNTHPQKLDWLKKIIIGKYNSSAALQIVEYISKMRKLNVGLANCLKDGLGERDIVNAQSFLHPTLVFLQNCVIDSVLFDTVENALELIDSTGGNCGSDFLQFVQYVGEIENKELGLERGALTKFVYGMIKNWAPVLLMHPNIIHADVRGSTVIYLHELLFEPLEGARISDPEKYRGLLSVIMELAEGCATYAHRTFLDPHSKDRMALQAGQANQVLTITDNCLILFTDNAEDEEKASRIAAIMEELRQQSDGIIETVSNTEWKDGSSDLEPLSEVELSELSP